MYHILAHVPLLLNLNCDSVANYQKVPANGFFVKHELTIHQISAIHVRDTEVSRHIHRRFPQHTHLIRSNSVVEEQGNISIRGLNTQEYRK